MDVEIENIASKKYPFWRPIYEVIENSYFEETKLFPTTFLNQCRNNTNEPHNIPNEIKTDFKIIAPEQCLYEQVVMIRRRDSYDKSKNKIPINITSK